MVKVSWNNSLKPKHSLGTDYEDQSVNAVQENMRCFSHAKRMNALGGKRRHVVDYIQLPKCFNRLIILDLCYSINTHLFRGTYA
jgi:hypothetical protein